MNTRLRTFRRREGLTIRDLALRIGISPSHLSRIERRTHVPSLRVVEKLVAETRGFVRADDFVERATAE